MYIGHYGLNNSKAVRQEENAMLEFRFPQGRFRKHDTHGLVLKHNMLLHLGLIFMNTRMMSYLLKMLLLEKRFKQD